MHSTKVLTYDTNWLPIIGSADSQEKKQILGLLQFNTVIVIVNFDAYLRFRLITLYIYRPSFFLSAWLQRFPQSSNHLRLRGFRGLVKPVF